MALRHWARKQLQPGDLTVLKQIAKREWVDPDAEQTARLRYRGFLRKRSNRATIKGRVALWARERRV